MIWTDTKRTRTDAATCITCISPDFLARMFLIAMILNLCNLTSLMLFASCLILARFTRLPQNGNSRFCFIAPVKSSLILGNIVHHQLAALWMVHLRASYTPFLWAVLPLPVWHASHQPFCPGLVTLRSPRACIPPNFVLWQCYSPTTGRVLLIVYVLCFPLAVTPLVNV